MTYRKVSGGSNSPWGAEATAMILSVTDTCRKQGRDPHAFLVQALLARAHPGRVPYPSFFRDPAAGPGARPTGPPVPASPTRG